MNRIWSCSLFISMIEKLSKIRYNGVLKGMLESDVTKNDYKLKLLKSRNKENYDYSRRN